MVLVLPNKKDNWYAVAIIIEVWGVGKLGKECMDRDWEERVASGNEIKDTSRCLEILNYLFIRVGLT